jgi:uncharacterized membrane protein
VIAIGMRLALVMASMSGSSFGRTRRKRWMVEASADGKAATARVAGMTSRINTMLSIPMLYCMVAQQNAGL